MQPPSGGCVLKLVGFQQNGSRISQPPSGGCVLKLFKFGCQISAAEQPPSGGCVLKPPATTTFRCRINAAAFGRLCVETVAVERFCNDALSSRLRAAVC